MADGIPKEEIKMWLRDYEQDIDIVREGVWTRKDHDRDMIALHMGTHEKGDEKQYKPIMWFDEEKKMAYKTVGEGHYLKGGESVEGTFVKDAIGIAFSVVEWLAEYGDIDIRIEVTTNIVREKVDSQPVLMKGSEILTSLSHFAVQTPLQMSREYEHQHFVNVEGLEIVNSPQSSLDKFGLVGGKNE